MKFIGFPFNVKKKRIYINGIKTNYSIYNIGIVYNHRRKCIQTEYDNGHNHWYVSLSVNGEKHKYFIHVLVATYFIPNKQKLPIVNHLDGNPHNNWYTNLEWCTQQRNVIHAYDMGLNHSGENNKRATLSNNEVISICEDLLENKLSMNEIAKKHHTTRKIVSHIRHKESWTRLTKEYDFSGYTVKEVGTVKGSRHGRVKITEKDAHNVCKMIDENPSYTMKEVSDKTGIDFQTVRNIRYGVCWKHISKDYKFRKK